VDRQPFPFGRWIRHIGEWTGKGEGGLDGEGGLSGVLEGEIPGNTESTSSICDDGDVETRTTRESRLCGLELGCLDTRAETRVPGRVCKGPKCTWEVGAYMGWILVLNLGRRVCIPWVCYFTGTVGIFDELTLSFGCWVEDEVAVGTDGVWSE